MSSTTPPPHLGSWQQSRPGNCSSSSSLGSKRHAAGPAEAPRQPRGLLAGSGSEASPLAHAAAPAAARGLPPLRRQRQLPPPPEVPPHILAVLRGPTAASTASEDSTADSGSPDVFGELHPALQRAHALLADIISSTGHQA